MPYSYPDRVPRVALHWTESEKRRCARAAQAVLDREGSEADAIFACIHAAGRSKQLEKAVCEAIDMLFADSGFSSER